MGRKTWESLPRRPLPGRANIVVSRNFDFETPGAFLMSSMDTAFGLAKSIARNENINEIFVIGGARIYQNALGSADRIHITEVDAIIRGDTYFPEFDASEWTEINSERLTKDDKNDYDTHYRCLERKA